MLLPKLKGVTMLKKRLIAIFAISALTVAGQVAVTASSEAATKTITVASPWHDGGLEIWNAAIARFEKANPGINVISKGNQDMAKSLADINAGTGPDISVANGPGNVGWFCATGAWKNLNKLINSPTTGIKIKDVFPAAVNDYTISQGNRCALPFTTEPIGMFYNKDLLLKAGFAKPPTTTEELLAYSKKLTTFDANGDIKTAGFVPWVGYNDYGFTANDLGNMFGAKWYKADGTPALGTDPQWVKAFNWQRTFIAQVFGGGDFAKGKTKLLKFVAGAGSPWGLNGDFPTGRAAIWIDAVWMIGLFCDPTEGWVMMPCNKPPVNFGVAPMPVVGALKSSLYGSARFGGNTMGIGRDTKNVAEAWKLIKFLATDTQLQVDFANYATQPPSTIAALNSKDLVYPAVYKPFIDIVKNKRSGYHKIMFVAEHLDEDELNNLMAAWQAGTVSNISTALKDASANIATIIARNSK